MFKKILASVLLVSLIIMVFSGCSDNAQSKYSLISEGKLIMGTNAEFPPFEYVQGDSYAGIDVDIVAEIAKQLGVELEINNMAFESLDSAMSGKTIDIVAAGLTVTAERATVYAFSDDYFEANQTIVVKADSEYTSKEDLTGKVIGGQTGNTGIIDCAKSITGDENIKGYNNGSLAVDALLAGEIDAVIVDDYPAQEYKRKHGDAITLIEKQFDIENYALAVHPDNKALLDKVNEILAGMKEDGSLQAIIDKYIN